MQRDPITTVALSRAEIIELLYACSCVDWHNDDFLNARNKLRRCCPTTTTGGRVMKVTLDNAPLEAIAPAIGGGHWTKTEGGWKWCNGATFPRPGGDWNGEIKIPFEAEQEGE